MTACGNVAAKKPETRKTQKLTNLRRNAEKLLSSGNQSMFLARKPSVGF
jgi:hypothetical protein